MEESNDKKPILETGNDGKVFWSKDSKQQGNKDHGNSGGLGEVECGKCFQHKPFETVRWNANALKYLCSECQEKI